MDRIHIIAHFDIATEQSVMGEADAFLPEDHGVKLVTGAIKQRFHTYDVKNVVVTAKGFNADGSCDQCKFDKGVRGVTQAFVHEHYHVERD